MAQQKEGYTQDEVDRMINEARTQMQFELLEQDYKEHKDAVEQTLSKILAKIDVVMGNEQIRTKELTEFRLGLKDEFSNDFVTKEEFKSMKRSIVWAVAIVVGIGGFIQWLLSAYTTALKLVGGI